VTSRSLFFTELCVSATFCVNFHAGSSFTDCNVRLPFEAFVEMKYREDNGHFLFSYSWKPQQRINRKQTITIAIKHIGLNVCTVKNNHYLYMYVFLLAAQMPVFYREKP
jgi:hypothetical protein